MFCSEIKDSISWNPMIKVYRKEVKIKKKLLFSYFVQNHIRDGEEKQIRLEKKNQKEKQVKFII